MLPLTERMDAERGTQGTSTEDVPFLVGNSRESLKQLGQSRTPFTSRYANADTHTEEECRSNAGREKKPRYLIVN